MEFTEIERAVLRIVQKDIPATATPFADIAAEVGCSEDEVLALLRRLKDDGTIRRFGASLSHGKTEWAHNVMVGWIVPEEHVDEAGKAAAGHPNVSHCYHRPSPVEDFPYSLYTMVHGRSERECEETVQALGRIPHMGGHVLLKTVRELKKCSPTYF